MTASHPGASLAAPSPGAALAALQQRGLRASAARRLVLEALYAADRPVTAEDIADGLGGRFPSSDLGSVYRNLDTLERNGLVRHLHAGHRAGMYATAGDESDYLACEACGALWPVDSQSLAPVREYLRRRFGVEPGFSHFPIVGRCEECRQ